MIRLIRPFQLRVARHDKAVARREAEATRSEWRGRERAVRSEAEAKIAELEGCLRQERERGAEEAKQMGRRLAFLDDQLANTCEERNELRQEVTLSHTTSLSSKRIPYPSPPPPIQMTLPPPPQTH